MRHVVAEVVETKFIVGPEGYISIICFSPCIGIGLMFVNTIDCKTMKLVDRPHPFRVTFCQVVVNGYKVYALTGKCIKKNRQCCNQCFSFSGGHLCDSSLMQRDTTD